MEKFSRMTAKCVILILVACGTLIIAGPAIAEKSDGPVVAPLFMGTSAIISSLARQIGFVKTFSADYPYQYEQKVESEKKGDAGKDEPKMRAK
jgi:hypothetical protein